MTDISFYVGKSSNMQARMLLACKLVEKARANNMLVHINLSSYPECERMDNLLWSYNDLSFIPHDILRQNTQRQAGIIVTIGDTSEPNDTRGLLINLTSEIPPYFNKFKKFAEIIDQEQDVLVNGRKRYAYYRKEGYNPDYYQL
jgi:DNA polymerase-3 subunit chi